MGGQSVNTGSSMGKMLITMLAGFAGFERNMIAERTTAASGSTCTDSPTRVRNLLAIWLRAFRTSSFLASSRGFDFGSSLAVNDLHKMNATQGIASDDCLTGNCTRNIGASAEN